jgi:proton-dependent oligopeptide transporter, POT family
MTDSTEAKHPKGLYVLFFTEMWERFGYYLLLGILSLYMLDNWDHGGMGFSKATKSDIYGTYLGLVYLTPFIGGLLADRVLGYRRSIVLGGLLMAAGYFCLAVHSETAFYLGLLLVILGNGFFKPNISTLVGNLYNDDRFRANKDAGYNIFYMGINVGAFICNFVAAYMRINFGWGYAFAAAGVGMLIGVVWFMSGNRHVVHADVKKPVQKEDLPLTRIFAYVLLPLFAFGFIGWKIPGNIFGTDSNDAFLFGSIPVLAYYASLWWRANIDEKSQIGALLAVFAAVIVFWAVFHQNGDALTIWAEEYTDRQIPGAVADAAQQIGIAKTLAWPADSANVYFHNLPADQRPAPGESLRLYSTELYQSINPFWVILLTPVVVGFFGFLRARRREPSTPEKIGYGLLITALSALVMVAAVYANNIHEEKAGAFWLFATYGVITIGELCLSPMGLSLVSKLSPPRITSLMMGGWFLSTSIGNKLSGVLSGMWEGYDNKANFFLTNFVLVFLAFLMFFAMRKWLRRVFLEKAMQ